MDRRTSIKLLGAAATAAITQMGRLNAAARPDVRPNIIVIVVDDLRWDEFSTGGHPYLKTPNIDRLAREGASFSRAMRATPLCSPNRACILTGQYVAKHGSGALRGRTPAQSTWLHHRHKLIHWICYPDLDELYDLHVDPSEETNLLRTRVSNELVADLRSKLAKLVQQSIFT